MPVTVEKKLATFDLRKGDLVKVENGYTMKITDIVRKIKWATVSFENGTARRIQSDHVWTVEREEQTDEEKKAFARAFTIRHLHEYVDAWASTEFAEVFAAKIVKNAEQGRITSDYSTLGAFLKGEALNKIARVMLTHVESMRNNDNLPDNWKSDEDELIVSAWAYWQYKLEQRSHWDVAPDPTSRSTAVLANLMEDLDRWAIAEAQDKLRWLYDGTLDARREEIKKWHEERRDNN